MQPQGRPAQVLRLIPGLSPWNIRVAPGKPTSIFCAGLMRIMAQMSRFSPTACRSIFSSHAHGQGYADLSFIIPETIEGLEAYKGAYHLEFGDFNDGRRRQFQNSRDGARRHGAGGRRSVRYPAVSVDALSDEG